MDRERRLAALFDMDGVVLDTEGQYDNFWREQGRRYHPDKPEFHKMIKGQTMELILKNYFEGNVALQQQISLELDEFESRMDFPYFPGVAFYPDVTETWGENRTGYQFKQQEDGSCANGSSGVYRVI